MNTFHPSADVPSSNIGMHTRIGQFGVLLSGEQIGDGCDINRHYCIKNDVMLGNKVSIKNEVYLPCGLRIEDEAVIDPNTTFVNDSYPHSQQYLEDFQQKFIRKCASISVGAIILGGVEMGEYAMIGACRIVTKSARSGTKW